MLLRYRTVIVIGRRSGPLLVGLGTGALLVGLAAVAQPTGMLPADWSTLLGAEAVIPPAATDPDGTRLLPGPLLPLPTITASAAARPTAAPAAPPTTTAAAAATTTAAPAHRPVASTRRAAPPAPAPSVSGSQAARVVALTNQDRARVGCRPLRVDARLTAATQGHSDDMSAHGYFSHDGQDGRSFSDRITAAGYPSPGGENIAQGQQDAQEVVTAWLNSPGHRRNIEDCSFTTIGVGLAGADRYWTQDFGR
ncbi:MAG: hypothetical protein QOF00_1851 [Pseudonocardiales bacterium]|jgi:uncharacterized protein YkwD|nr:hypothetical protein [Pseudonocardiales bacterium]